MSQPPRANLRVSDADRDLVTQVLNSAYAEGRITSEELDERLSHTLSSKTFGDLEVVTADLMPRATAHEQYRTALPPSAPVVDSSRPVGAEPDRIIRILGEAKRTGSWRLAPRTSVVAIMGEVTLDLRTATMESRHCEININATMGEVKIFVPEGVEVIGDITAIMGEDKRKGLGSVPVGSPQIRLSGFMFMGQITIIGPEHISWAKRLGLR